MNKESLQFNYLTSDGFNNSDLIMSLCSFYNRVSLRGHNEVSRSISEFEEATTYTLSRSEGRAVFSVDVSGQICGYIAGYRAHGFAKDTYQLDKDVPEGRYYYVYGLGNDSGDVRVTLGLIKKLLDSVQVDFVLGLVDHQAEIYKKGTYLTRGWMEIQSTLEFAKGCSYFYTPLKKVLKDGDKSE